ncbi:MAG TPA: AI-2E family transporter YdiK [Planctomycetota bacterium]|nr:AI-2E family transporter YdiK [Planctomycetota bacterium]
MIKAASPNDLPRTVLAVLFLGALIASSLWVLRPFLAPLVWAALLVIASWPAMHRIEAWLGNRRRTAIAVMIGLVLLVFIIPFVLMLGVLIEQAPDAVAWVRQTLQQGLPAMPAWVAEIPGVGKRIATKWSELAAAGPDGLTAHITPYAEILAAWFVRQAGGVGLLVLQFLLTLLLTGVFFARGEAFAAQVLQFARRLAGERGERAAVLAAKSVRAVAIGVVVTALVQSIAGGFGLLIAGVPAVGMLTALMFVASIAQIGAAPVLVLAAIWLFCTDATGWGIALLVWAVFVGSIDNVIRPLLIRKGVELPLMLIFAGVIGGLVAYGPIGLFVGPVVLAVGHALLLTWIGEGEPTNDAAPVAAAP